ncbi:MAG: hypothetical protein CMJ27_01845 [Phycisphaerae bacterium]|nr:hypothetical protein [Phycisphaerae bacterium]OUX02956.1 MAG: hypothetical protein CBD91_01280 [Phycisphaeraceae bacterium TMED231]
MRFPPEIRHTCGNLLWLRRQAAFEQARSSGDEASLHERFLKLARLRFGRDLSNLGDESSPIEEFGRGIQTLPQIDVAEPRQVLRAGLAGAGRLLLLPGLHGAAAVFVGLTNEIASPMEIVGWEHLGLDDSYGRPKRIEDPAARILDRERDVGLQEDQPLVIFGFCIGGLLGHAILKRHGDRPGRLIILDGHPAESIRTISRTRRVLGTVKAVRDARLGGHVEHRLVRIGLDRLRAMGLHRTGSIKQDIVLYRSGTRLGFGPLDAAMWRDHARSVRQIDLPDLGHTDVFRNGLERRIVGFLEAG